MDTLNSIENVSVNIVLSITAHLGEQQKLFWIQGSSDSHISYLLKYICLQLKQKTKPNICYVNAKFAAETLLDNLRGEQTEWQNIKESEILIVKDIDYLCDKTTTQEEFSKLFLTKIAVGEKIIIASKCQPEELPVLSDRLFENFELIKI